MSTAPAESSWIPSTDHFGARLALVRQRMGWGNVSEAALACGQPVSSWRNWERDGRMPRNYIEVCQAIAARTGVDLAWLAGLGQQGSAVDPGRGFINACSSHDQPFRTRHLHVVTERPTRHVNDTAYSRLDFAVYPPCTA